MKKTSPSDLLPVMGCISSNYIFTPKNYPALEQLSTEQKLTFVVSHCVHHINKSVGKISAECEKADHLGNLNHVALRSATVKLFIDTLTLAQKIGMTADDLCEFATKFIENK